MNMIYYKVICCIDIPHLEHPLEHHGLVILLLFYHDHWRMLCAMESGQTEQNIILMSYTSTNYDVYNKSN